MWLEIKVNTGNEQLRFRSVPWEAESAKTKAERDSFALCKETRETVYVGILFAVGKRCDGPMEI